MIDTEILAALTIDHINNGKSIDTLASYIKKKCKGVVSCAIALPEQGKLIVFSNNGSLYIGSKNEDFYFASEEHSLKTLSCNNIEQLLNNYKVVDIPLNKKHVEIKNFENPRLNLVPELLLTVKNFGQN